jgi:L-iditol 2-dehydrogenase
MTAMRIARYHHNRAILIESVARPVLGAGDVLVRVHACGVCGSDAMEWFRVPKSPRILGHEIAGVVAASRSGTVSVGDRVVVRNQLPCGDCYACMHGHPAVCENQTEIEPGGMAEYVRIPGRLADRGGLTPLPANVSFAAGTLTEPVACVLHAQALARVRPDQCVVVLGCGVVGLLHIQVARAAGVERIIAVDPVPFRRAAAARLGATLVLDPADDLPEATRHGNDGRLADVAILASAVPAALVAASAAVSRHGTLLMFAAADPGTPAPLTFNQLFWRRELTIVSSYGAGDADFGTALGLIAVGKVDTDTLITHTLPLDRVEEAFALVATAGESLKVVLDLS